jgi:hypothetical protein
MTLLTSITIRGEWRLHLATLDNPRYSLQRVCTVWSLETKAAHFTRRCLASGQTTAIILVFNIEEGTQTLPDRGVSIYQSNRDGFVDIEPFFIGCERLLLKWRYAGDTYMSGSVTQERHYCSLSEGGLDSGEGIWCQADP